MSAVSRGGSGESLGETGVTRRALPRRVIGTPRAFSTTLKISCFWTLLSEMVILGRILRNFLIFHEFKPIFEPAQKFSDILALARCVYLFQMISR